ncbi:MAG: TAXI family TRAP transporter solute-binding subunit, partial [Rickettsiales bacterium]
YKYFPTILYSLLFLTVFALFVNIVQAKDSTRQAPITVVTGLKTGTYYIFGRDIFEMAKKSGIDVNVKTSEGSIDNIKHISNGENVTLGIVQSDVLGFLGRSKNPDSMKIAEDLRMLFPFYNEEIHVLARKEITDFKDLQGKKVAIGEEGSGNMLTSINLFSMMNITPAESQKIPSAQGVVAVLKGEADAVIFVGGKPIRLFKNLEDLTLPENEKYASMLDKVHFIPMNSVKMLEEYKPAEILPSDYKFVKEPVPTVSVQAVLVSYDFSQANDSKHSDNVKRCEQISKFSEVLRAGLPALQETGHAKWKEVNLDANVGSWKKDSCAWGLLSTPAKRKAVSKDLLDILDKK